MNIEAIPRHLQPNPAYRSRKAAQACAYFAAKCEMGIDKLKLIKLIYLSEREHLATKQRPIFWDDLRSLPHGPIGSSTLNGIDGFIHQEIWSHYIARNGNKVFSTKRFARDDFDELSNSEIKSLSVIWEKYNKLSASALRNYTHDNCDEYTETEKKSIPIEYSQLLLAVGMDEKSAFETEAELLEWRNAQAVLHS